MDRIKFLKKDGGQPNKRAGNYKMLIKYAAAAMLGSSAMYDVEPLVPMGRTIGPGVRQYGRPRSRYMPHQGDREIARRQRRAVKAPAS